MLVGMVIHRDEVVFSLSLPVITIGTWCGGTGMAQILERMVSPVRKNQVNRLS